MDNWTLSPEQVHSFAQNGYLRVPNVLADWELAALQRESSAWIAADRHRGGAPAGPDGSDWLHSEDPRDGQAHLHRINTPHAKRPAFLAAYAHPAVLNFAEAVMGPNFLPWTDALVLKLPEYGVPVPWHRDPGHAIVQPAVDVDICL
jgi:hypothetical protein